MAKEKANGNDNTGKERKDKEQDNSANKKSFFNDDRVRFTIGLFTLLEHLQCCNWFDYWLN